jgi:hypothetical protein
MIQFYPSLESGALSYSVVGFLGVTSLEGLNSIVQAAKRKARGYKTEHMKTIAYLITGGLDFKRINSYLPT